MGKKINIKPICKNEPIGKIHLKYDKIQQILKKIENKIVVNNVKEIVLVLNDTFTGDFLGKKIKSTQGFTIKKILTEITKYYPIWKKYINSGSEYTKNKYPYLAELWIIKRKYVLVIFKDKYYQTLEYYV